MSICSYLYASGLRVESGHAVVELDGKRYRVVRTGKGTSRLNRPSDDPRSDGEITLKDLEARLAAEGRSVITATVETADGSFPLTLDPANAMGRQGREAGVDQAAAYEALFPDEQRALAAYQLKTLPYQNGSDPDGIALKRFRAALAHVKISDLAPDAFSEGFWSLSKGSVAHVQALRHVLSTDPTRFTHDELVEFFKEHPHVVLEHAAGRLADEEIAAAFESALASYEDPADEDLIKALLVNAADRIPGALVRRLFTDVMLVDEDPAGAIDIVRYASDRLSDAQIATVFEASLAGTSYGDRTWAAVLEHAADRLTDEHVSAAFARDPLATLARAPHRLSSDHLAICAVRHPDATLAHAAAMLSPAQLATAVAADPAAALEHAAEHLTPEQLATATKADPQAALIHAAAHLPAPLLDGLIEQMPAAVLTYAAEHLTPEQLDRAFDKDGLHRTALIHAADRLTDAHLDRIVAEEPADALKYAADRLTDGQFNTAFRARPHLAAMHAADRLTDEHLGLLVASHPAEALTYAADRLTDEQFSLAFAASPLDALKAAPGRLSPVQVAYLVKNHPQAVFESPSMPYQARVDAVRSNRGIISTSTVFSYTGLTYGDGPNTVTASNVDRAWHVNDRAAFDALLEAAPEEAVKHVPEKITVAQLDRVVDAAPVDVYMAHRGRLSKAQISRAIDAAPLTVLAEDGGASFTPEQLERAFAENPAAAVAAMRAGSHSGKAVPIPAHLLDRALQSNLRTTLEHAAAELSSAQLDAALTADTATTLRFASRKLSTEQLSTAVTQRPGDAIRFAADRLTDEQLAEAAKRAPRGALAYAAGRLSDEQIGEAAKREPAAALQFAADRLSDRQVARAVDDCPADHALQYVPHRLSRRQLDAALKQDNTLAPALADAWPYLSEKQRNKLIDAFPSEVLRVRGRDLTGTELSRAARLNPEAALRYAEDRFSPSALLALDEIVVQRRREQRNRRR